MATDTVKADYPVRGRNYYMQRTWMLYLMLILPMVFFAVFRYVPMTNIVIAFKDYNIFET